MKRALGLDPLSLVYNADVGQILLFARRSDEAIGALKKATEMDPNRWDVHLNLGLAYEQKGLYEEAVAEYLKGLALRGENWQMIPALKEAYTVSGMRGFCQEYLNVAKEKSKRGYVSPAEMASLYARLGETDQALAWLERAYDEHEPQLVNLNVEPMLDSLHSDPRFADLLRRMGLDSPSHAN